MSMLLPGFAERRDVDVDGRAQLDHCKIIRAVRRRNLEDAKLRRLRPALERLSQPGHERCLVLDRSESAATIVREDVPALP